MAGIGAGTGAAALTDADKENAFLFEQWNAMSDEERERAGGKLADAPAAWKNEMLAKYRGAKALGGSDEALEAAKDATRAEDTARAVYDSGTLTSRDDATDHSMSDLSKVSTDIASGKVAAPRKSAEAIGKRATTSAVPITSEDDSKGVVARGVEDTIASIESNPAIENVLYESGVNIDAETAPNINDIKKLEGYMESSTGSNPLNKDPRKVVKDANELGTWDYIAIGLTALSAVLFAATGGEMQPIDFTAIGGTNQRIAALTEIRKQRDEFRSRMVNEQTLRETWDNMTPAEKALYGNNYKEYRKELSRSQYETSEKFAQDEADLQTLLTVKDIEQKYAKELLDINGKWDMAKIRANAEIQKDLATTLQRFKEGEDANIIKNLIEAGCTKEEAIQKFGMSSDGQRLWDNILKTIGTVGTAAGSIIPG